MTAGPTVAYVGSSADALALAETLSDGAVTVLAVSDGDDLAALFDDGRVDCVVCADATATTITTPAIEASVPVIADGIALDDATSTVDADAEVDRLAAAVEELVPSPEPRLPGYGLDSTTRLTRILDRIDDGFFALDADWRFTFLNDLGAEMIDRDPEAVIGESIWAEFPQLADTVFEHRYREAMATQEQVSFEARYEPHGAWYAITAYPAPEGLSVFFEDVTARQERERRLRSLTESTHAMMLAGTDEEIAALAVEAADDVLSLPWTTVWRYNEAEDAFTSLARSDAAAERFGDATLAVQPDGTDAFSARDTPIWESFVEGELRIVDDLGADYDPDSLPIRSGIVAPLSDYGVVVAGSPSRDARTDGDVELFRILATSTESALLRAQRERELQRQIDRLDEFVGVVSHDLRNPLQVATARLDTYRQTGDETHLDHVADSHDRMARLIDDVLTLAREGKAVEDSQQVTLATVAVRAWAAVDAPDATLETPTSATLVADPDRLQRLFENLFRNAVEHGGADVTVRVDADEHCFYVEDDGPGIPEDDRETRRGTRPQTREPGSAWGSSGGSPRHTGGRCGPSRPTPAARASR